MHRCTHSPPMPLTKAWEQCMATSQHEVFGPPTKSHHINYLELLAVYLGLKAFCSSHRDMHISLRIYNTTAVAVINHMGTSHSQQLNTLNVEIWEWCIAHNLWISAGHIAGKCNVEADQASSQNQIATEWMLPKTLL